MASASRFEDAHVYGYLRTQGVVYQLEEVETSIGRGEECSLQLDGKGISRMHARLTFAGRRPQLLDLGSSNGTFVNGLRLKPNIAHDLKHGDVVRFAQARCTYSFELPPEGQKTPKTPKDNAEPPGQEETPPRPALKSNEDGKEKPGKDVQPAYPGSAAVPCVNVLPVPFPVMQPGMPGMPGPAMQPMQLLTPSHSPPQPPVPAVCPHPSLPECSEPIYPRRSSAIEESEMLQKQDLLLQRLWKLEQTISRLADANLEVCQRASPGPGGPGPHDTDKREEEEPSFGEAEEAHLVAAALTAATERLASAESQNTEASAASAASASQAKGSLRFSENKAELEAGDPAAPVEAHAELMAEMQRMLALYEMVVGVGKPDYSPGTCNADTSSSSSGSAEKAPPKPLFEGAVGETSVVLAAIMSALEELAAMGYANPSVGGHRRWNALAHERERLAKEEEIESQRLRELEDQEGSFRQSTEAELSELSRILEGEDAVGIADGGPHPMFQDIPQTKLTAQQAYDHLQTELARVEADKARLEVAATSLSEELSETYGQYQEEKSKADTASKFFASREELADELQEWLYSGRSERMAALGRMRCLAQTQLEHKSKSHFGALDAGGTRYIQLSCCLDMPGMARPQPFRPHPVPVLGGRSLKVEAAEVRCNCGIPPVSTCEMSPQDWRFAEDRQLQSDERPKDTYLVPKVGFQPIVPGGTIPKAPNEAGSLFTEVKKNAKYPGPDHYKKEGKPFGQKAKLGMFSRINRDEKDPKKNWPSVGQYQSTSDVTTPRTRGGIMAKSTRGCLIYDQAVTEGKWKPAPGKYDPQKPEKHVDCLQMSPENKASRTMVAAAALGGFLACEALHRWRNRRQEVAKPHRSPDEEWSEDPTGHCMHGVADCYWKALPTSSCANGSSAQLQLPRAATAKKAMLKYRAAGVELCCDKPWPGQPKLLKQRLNFPNGREATPAVERAKDWLRKRLAGSKDGGPQQVLTSGVSVPPGLVVMHSVLAGSAQQTWRYVEVVTVLVAPQQPSGKQFEPGAYYHRSACVPEPAPKRDEPAKVIERAVTVCVRVRPMADSEIADGQTQVVACDLDAPGKIHLTRPSGGAEEPNRKQETYVFDTVLPGSAGQAAVYNLIGSPLVASLAAGYHSCVLGFGATGCGKSHTIFGGPGEARGILPRLSEKLFAAMDAVDGKTIASLSYMEIYNDKVRDLLHPEPGEQHEAPAALNVCEHPKAGVFVTGLTRSAMSDAENILRLIDYGHKIRVLASAQRSSPSSRSTAIAMLHLEQVLAGSSGTWPQQKWRHAKLQVVDLAGAEHLHAGEVARQRGSFQSIGSSGLSAMAEMVAALAKGTRGESSRYHLPYRDSKLSLLLAEALTGNCRTAVVTCVSPASRRADLTSSALRFGESVQKLHTRSTRNEEVHGDLVQTLRGEIHLLRQRLERCSPAEIRGLEEQLQAAQYLEEEYSASHEELQERSATAEQQRQRSLRRLGLRVGEPREQKVSDGRIYVVNVSLDPLLSGCLTWTLLPGEQLHIGSNPNCEICVDGLGVQPEVCSLRCVQASRLEVVPQLVGHTAKKCQDGLIVRRRSLFKRAGPLLVNGQTVEATLALRSGDVLRVGWAHFFRVVIPACASENDRRLGPRPEDALAIETTYSLTFPKDAEQLKERLGADRAAQVLGGLKDLKLAVDEANELTKELRGDSDEEFSFKGHRLMDPLNSTEATTLVVSLLRQRRPPGQAHFDEDNGGCNLEDRSEVVATWTLPDFQQRLEVMREVYDEVALRDQPWGEEGDLDPWQAQSGIPVLKAASGPGPEESAHTQEAAAASLPMWKQLSSATSASTGAETSEERMDMAAVLQQLPQLHAELAKAYELQDVQASELVSVRREIEDLRMNLARATPSPVRRPGDPSRGSGTLSPLRGGEEAEMPLLSKSNLVPSTQTAGGAVASAAVAAAVRQTPPNRASTPRRPRAPVAPVWRGAEGPRISSSPTGRASNEPLMSSDSPLAEALPSPRSELLEEGPQKQRKLGQETAVSEDLHEQGSALHVRREGTIARDVSFGAGMPDSIKYYISAQQEPQLRKWSRWALSCPGYASMKPRGKKSPGLDSAVMQLQGRIAILFGQSASASFHSKWEILMGQGEVQNWMKSTPGHDVQMRYPGEWKFAGGVVDADETPEEAARRELEEEFQVPVALTKATCKLRLMSIKQTRPIRNISNIMFNYVAAAEENPWLQQLDVEEVNCALSNRRRMHAEAIRGGNFYTLGHREQEKLAPEIHQVQWLDMRSAVRDAFTSMNGSFHPVNDFQKKEFERLGVKRRDPMFLTMATLLEVDSFPSLRSFIVYSDRLDPEKELQRIQWLRDGMTPEEVATVWSAKKSPTEVAERAGMFRTAEERLQLWTRRKEDSEARL
ncbi:KIF13B [Symbiodinium necroappetens]|uniref:KIF13B protein n=1 Tax=Symbiodinium necroappetens TaxID=1628268 RepID=A0A812IPP5_9DINO|nr:KIF13B [Symbiodinium necroappetens]